MRVVKTVLKGIGTLILLVLFVGLWMANRPSQPQSPQSPDLAAQTNSEISQQPMELPPFGGHSIIGHAMPMRRCSHAPQQASLSA
jgi:hypothetical protein